MKIILVLSKDTLAEKLVELGFKPKYDEYTEELKEYFYVNTEESGNPRMLGIQFKKRKVEPWKLRFRFTFGRDKRGVPDLKKGKFWVIDNSAYYYTDFDKLYDLIKLDIVEKMDVNNE